MRPLIASIIACCVVSCSSPSMVDRGGVWSAEAIRLDYTGEQRKLTIASPDGQKRIVIDGPILTVATDHGTLASLEDLGVSSLAEVCWSQDSRRFAITESYGGAVGEWLVTVYNTTDSSVEAVDVSETVVREFTTGLECPEDETPNVGFVSWIDGSSRLLLALEVPPHSSCSNMGAVKAYVVEIPSGTVVGGIEERALRQEWGTRLGQRFSTE